MLRLFFHWTAKFFDAIDRFPHFPFGINAMRIELNRLRRLQAECADDLTLQWSDSIARF
jgi:hypothetical protein